MSPLLRFAPPAALAALLLSVTAVGADGRSAGPAPQAHAAAKACGTYKSTSIYRRARVFAIRGVGCKRARRVAIRYDRKGQSTGRWQCFLAHGDMPRLFSCGYPPKGGDIRKSRHALEVRGVGKPRS